MANSTIGITEPASPNKLLDSESLTVGLNTVERERVQITGTTATDIAPVTAADGLSVKVTNTVPVSGTVSVTEPVSVDAINLDIRDLVFASDKVDASGTVLGASSNNIGDVDVLTVPAPLSTTGGGTEATALRVTIANDSTGLVSVDDNSGSLTVDQPTASNLNAQVVGAIAHDSGVSGNPLSLAAIAQDMDDTAPPNQVSAENDVVRIAADRDGGIFVHPHGPRLWDYHENSSSALTDATVHAAPSAGLSLYVGTIVVSTGAAVNFNIFFEEGATTVLGPYYLEAIQGRGVVIQFNPPKKITAATALTVTTSAAIAHSIDVTGFIAQG